MQGFQTPIPEANFIVDGMGALGNVHTERGLTYYEVALSGHMYVTPVSSRFVRLFAEWGMCVNAGSRSSRRGYVLSSKRLNFQRR